MKRFTGLSKEERKEFQELLLALAFKYSEDSEANIQIMGDKSFLETPGQKQSGSSMDPDNKSSENKAGEPKMLLGKEKLQKSPKEIKAELDSYVIGQEEAKRILSVAFFNHARRINAYDIAVNMGQAKDFNIGKSNVIILGPTGTGKTYLVEILSKIFDIPFYCADSSTITQSGFVGKSAHEVIEQLYLKSGKDLKKTERGIVFLDEIDKLATTKEGRQNHMVEGAQQSLLKMIEGADVEIEVASPDKGRKITVDTRNILFVLAGAFVGLVGADKKQGSIGLVKSSEEEYKNKKITSSDLIKYGMIPELVGRISMIAQMHPLSKEDLVEILKKSKNNVIEQYSSMFSYDQIDVNFEEESYSKIAEKAIELKSGARSLKSIVDYLMIDKIYDVEVKGEDKTKTINIDYDYVKNKLEEFDKIQHV